ncbi:TonB-dependent receptor [Sphingomonas canadensis]|uniref:TonB-dependent receptor n=1 Tax=Sphingomonas canadensis TaxID=1219257 RepID=A0ABW3HE51_9SPHN|nr:TonB-dependent receptor [Sphingomonas canadensis]MCW3837648.1 TonB-dependent receptor [Sphingomonas canadensis]
MKDRIRAIASTTALGAALLWASAAAAQDQEQEAPANDSGVADIVVTAERRAVNLQDVPIAATAITGEQLRDKGVERLADLQYAAPSLSITDQGLTQSVNIRGIGIASGSPAVANGVATYIDGVFQPPILTASSFFDIGTIEVLRGPQGTLVGSNSTGGAIFVNTQNPSTDKVKGYAEASYGSYDAIGLQGALNLPISDTLAVRVAGTTRWRDSYYTDIGPFANEPGKLDEQAVRVGVMWQPANFRALAKVEWIDKNTGGYAYRPIAGSAFAADRQPDFRTLTYNSPTLNYERAINASLELRYELDSGTVLRSVSGYTNKRINNLYDSDGSRLDLQAMDQFVRERQWTQEVNIISPLDGAFNWILGGYFQKNKIDVIIQTTAASITDPTDILNFQNKQTLGAFAQGGYKVTDAVEVQLGVRYSHYKVDGDGSVIIGAGGPIFGPSGLQVADLKGSHEDGRLTGKIGVNWNLGGENLIYAFAARGYKPGGANSATSEFGPETVWDYEIGWKASFLDNHLRTQFGAFYMEYKDFQFDAMDTSTGQNSVLNISNANIKGFELQAQARASGFGFDAGLAYVDSKLAAVSIVNTRALPALNQFGPQCPVGTPSNPPVCFDFGPYQTIAGGGPNLFSPKWSYNFGLQYEADLGGGLSLTPRVNYAHVGSRWTNLLYSPATDYLKGYGLLSAQITLQKDQWKLEGYATNLANKAYVSGQSVNNEFYRAPREFGIRISTRF